MAGQNHIKEVAGCLNAAGHDLERARQAARRVSEQDGHDVAQLECAVKLSAAGWWKRALGAGMKVMVWRERDPFGRLDSR